MEKRFLPNKMKTLCVIPARYRSSRFPAKALADIHGKPMVVRTYERAIQAGLDEVLIATDDLRIERACQKADARVVMTSSLHPSGTDRVAEVAERFGGEIVVNLQGDEPLMRPSVIRRLVEVLKADETLDMASAFCPIHDDAEAENPNIVKVVCDKSGHALYFSRAPIPFTQKPNHPRLRHLGIYAYRAESLFRFVELAQSPLELLEKLEQLRALEHRFSIKMIAVEKAGFGVDTREDLQRLLACWKG